MTISSAASKVIGSGNGVTTSWPYAFHVPTTADIEVIYTDAQGVETVLDPSAYSVSGIGSAGGGTVTYPLTGPAIAAGTRLTIRRVLALSQPTDLKNQGGYYPEVLEAALDRLEMQVQQLAEQVGRAVVAQISSPTAPVDLVDTLTQLVADAQQAADDGSFLQSGTGALERTTQDKLRDAVSVLDFIPEELHEDIRAGTDTTDLADYFTAAFAAHTAVRIPRGVYNLDSCPTSPAGSFALIGEGSAVVMLNIRHGGTRALHFAPASIDDQVQLSGLTLQAAYESGPCPLAVDIEFPSTSSYPYSQLKIEDVRVQTDLSVEASPWGRTWARGFRVKNVWNAVIEKVTGSSYPDLGNTSATGFIEAVGGDYALIAPNISACRWYYGAAFLLGSAYMEGVYISRCEGVGVTRGVSIPSSTPPGGVAGLYRGMAIWLSESHISSVTAAFDLDTVVDFRARGMNVQRHSGSNWKGYDLNEVQCPQISGGTIAGNDSGTPTTKGIEASGTNSAHGVVVGVHFENLDTQFSLDSNTSHWTIRANVSTGTTPDTVSIAGANHDIEWFLAAGQVYRWINGHTTTGAVLTRAVQTSVNNAAGVTYTVANILTGFLFRNGAAGAVTDTTPTAAQIVAAFPGSQANTGYEFTISNGNGGLLTLAAGTGVTLVGTTTVANAWSRRYSLQITNATPGTEAVNLIGLQTGQQ